MTTRLGAIGLGTLGMMQLHAAEEIDGVEIVAGADVSSEARESVGDEFDVPTYEGYEAMLEGEDLDAATIATPHTLHHEQTAACLERDVHVHLEKPMVTDVADALDLIERAEVRDLVLQIGYQRHFHPAYRKLRSVLERGEIGDGHAVNCHLSQDWIDRQAGTWRTNPELSGGGQLMDSGSHLLDALLWTTRSEPREVAAVMDDRDHDVDVNSALAVTLDGPDGPITASVGISGDGLDIDERIVVLGTDGRATYDGEELTVENTDGRWTFEPDEDATDYVELTRKKLAAFVEAIETGGESPVPGEYGLQVTALSAAAYRARETGETVDVQALLDAAK